MRHFNRAEIADMLHQAFQQDHARQIAEPLNDPEEVQLKKFGAWCRTKPPMNNYNYANPPVCAIGQWYKSMGMTYEDCSGMGVLEYFAKIEPHTFGALAERIEYASPIDFEIARHYV